MKKTGILNKDICEIIASMGHMDTLLICDAGYPIPQNTRRIDLALKPGIPSFIDTTQSISDELKIDRIIVAEEIRKFSPEILESLKIIFKDVEIQYCSHAELKELGQNVKAIVRTGEFTPYANVILVSGVMF